MKAMDCAEARSLLLGRARGELRGEVVQHLEAHLATCEACRQGDVADRELSKLLEQRLQRPAAPESLRQTLKARHGRPRPVTAGRLKRAAGVLLGAAAGAALTAALFLAWPATRGSSPLVTEAVNDHLRTL